MFLLIFIAQAIAQIYDCPISNPTDCNDSYKPVCGLTISDNIIETFTNYCHACKAAGVLKYQEGVCSETQAQIQLPQNKSSSNYTEVFQCSDPRPSVCSQIPNQVCGLFDSTFSKGTDPIRLEFLNECHACSNSSITSYFIGNCSSYIPQPDTPIIEYCNVTNRPTECLMDEQIETCGFLNEDSICMSPPCRQPFLNPCRACQQKNITSFYKGSCSNYPFLFKKAALVELTEKKYANYTYCSYNRPETCEIIEKTQSQACGIKRQCNGPECQLLFASKCEACQDIRIEGYYPGACQYGNRLFISLMIMTLFIIFI